VTKPFRRRIPIAYFSLYARITPYYDNVNLRKPRFSKRSAALWHTRYPYVKYLSPLLLFGLNGVVILNGVSGGTRSAVFFSVLLLNETLTPARWLGAAMVLGGAMLAEFVHPRK
jgi:hypothetical protein